MNRLIIFTRSKIARTSADISFGITMIEAGIHRVVPVDLRELTLPHYDGRTTHAIIR